MSRLRRPTVEDILRGGFATTWDAPTVPRFPFTFRNVEVLTLAWRTERAAMEFLLPPPIAPLGDVAMAHIYRMNDTDWLMFGAELPGTAERGSYSLYLFLSSDAGVVHGCELHGQPKKLGEVRLEARGDLLVGTVARNGIDVITGTLPYKQVKAELSDIAAYLDFATNINLKMVDHIDGTPAIRQLTSRRLAELRVHECWRAPCTVELRPNAQAPVHRLPVREMLEGFYWRTDFTLVPGRVIHGYLREAHA